MSIFDTFIFHGKRKNIDDLKFLNISLKLSWLRSTRVNRISDFLITLFYVCCQIANHNSDIKYEHLFFPLTFCSSIIFSTYIILFYSFRLRWYWKFNHVLLEKSCVKWKNNVLVILNISQLLYYIIFRQIIFLKMNFYIYFTIAIYIYIIQSLIST